MKTFDANNFLQAEVLTPSMLLQGKELLTGLFYVEETIQTWKKGSYVFLLNGLLHNDSGPAYITTHSLTFARNGQLHKQDGPAICVYDRSVCWDSKKFVPAEGSKVLDFQYFSEGLLHRVDGVAAKNQYGKAQFNHYSIFGQKLSLKEYRNHPLVLKERS